jgi:putative mRNA 3-end processing factor
VFADIRAWWRANREAGRASVLFGYALGKAQRLLAGLADAELGPVYTHGAVERLNRDYRRAGVRLAETRYASEMPRGHDFAGSLIVAPPSAAGSTWLRRFGTISTGFASGWMRVRGNRRRRALDRGFVLSDHVDWPSILAAVEGTGAHRVWVTHGTREPLVRWLTERGIEATVVKSQWKGEEDTDPVEVAGEEISA